MSAALRRSVTSLQIPNYRRYFAGQIVSLSGNWMQMVAEMWLILELTGSGVAVGVTSALQFLPILLFGAWGGVLADRWPKRNLLVVTQTAMAVPALVLWALTASGAVEPWMVFGLVFVRGAVNSVDNPTRQSFVIEMVGADRVVNAVGLNSVLIHAARILGPAGAGALILTVGVAPCFLINAATFGAMILALRAMDPQRLSRAGAPGVRGRAGRRRGAELRTGPADVADPPGDDGRRRHARLQLPGPAAAARTVHLRRRRVRVYGARRRDGGRLGSRRPRHRRPRPGHRTAAGRLRGGLRRNRAARRRGAVAAPGAGRVRAARSSQRHVRRRRQLDPPARGEPGDARPGDGALLGRLPRLDADRRPARRLARRGCRPARRPGPRRRRGALRGRRRLVRVRAAPR